MKFQFFLASPTKSELLCARHKRRVSEVRHDPCLREERKMHVYFNIVFDRFIIDSFFARSNVVYLETNTS